MARPDRPLTAADFHHLVENIAYDQVLMGTEDNLALQTAGSGLQRLRATVLAEGRAATVKIVVKSGASKRVAEAIVDEAARDATVLPLELLSVLTVESQQERIRQVPEAMVSYETSRWIDGVDNIDDDEPASLRSTESLLEQARQRGDAFASFRFLLMVSKRVLRADWALRAAFYLLSNDLERDRQAYGAGEGSTEVRQVFDLVGKVLDGSATDKETETFRQALLARVEQANGMEPGTVRDALRERTRKETVDPDEIVRYSHRGPDAMVWSTTPDGRPHLIVGFASPLATIEEAKEIGYTIDERWRDLPMTDDADLLVVTAGVSPVMEPKRMMLMGEDAQRVAAWADDVAVVRAANVMLAMVDPTVVPAMTRGQAAFAGWFQAARPVLFDGTFATTLQGAIDRLMATGYPQHAGPGYDIMDPSGYGHQIMRQTFSALNEWPFIHPESFPYFGKKEVVDWVEKYPVFMGGMASMKSSTRLALRDSRNDALDMTEKSRAKVEQSIRQHRAHFENSPG
ncbi:hypothetical protein [Burkholderia vietnamiensis]|uniref:hypothetical protein n=1 Tax=Burkholderia vietnamiensis TaxID=60552 RepID=UPI001CF49D62|nr:hypothetical protein [Burkholderia vietnamiensis]MCA8180635.1 hypothetical protein [Burkholderia vietnamiensis]